MRIIAGAWRGRTLAAPPARATRPTADRVRQALFDRLLHAPWAGRAALHGINVLDAFAGTGAYGLEALSRGAARATFIEHDRDALAAIRANITACAAAPRCRVLAADARRPPPGTPCALVLLDPPYASGLLAPAVAALARAGWIAPGALLAAEAGHDEPMPELGHRLAAFTAGAAQVAVFRMDATP